jgi:hypothetical protein
MTSAYPISPLPEILSNPHGGAVGAAELALLDAQHALERRASAREWFEAAAAALAEAGWLSAQRYALLLAQAAQARPEADLLCSALGDLRAVLARRNLREIACSPQLWAHYAALQTLLGQGGAHTPAAAPPTSVSEGLLSERDGFAGYALAGRVLPPVVIVANAPERVARARAQYEAQLLGILRAEQPGRPQLESVAATLGELAGAHPYDFWRLAATCARSQAAGGRFAKQWFARINLLLAQQARQVPDGELLYVSPALRGTHPAPHPPAIERAERSESAASGALLHGAVHRALVGATLALLWRDLALYGAAPEDGGEVSLLRDYGLHVEARDAERAAGAALWASSAEPVKAVRRLGAVTVDAHAYEDFLQTADTALGELAPEAGQSGQALQAAAAAERVGAAAAALGLGQAALLADALSLAWRHGALAGATQTDTGLLAQAAEALRAALYKIAAGMPPPDLANARGALADYLATHF